MTRKYCVSTLHITPPAREPEPGMPKCYPMASTYFFGTVVEDFEYETLVEAARINVKNAEKHHPESHVEGNEFGTIETGSDTPIKDYMEYSYKPPILHLYNQIREPGEEPKFLLCHKCAGILSKDNGADSSGLLGCQCISGWIRGHETPLTREQVIRSQIDAQIGWAELYETQKRSEQEILLRIDMAVRLEQLCG